MTALASETAVLAAALTATVAVAVAARERARARTAHAALARARARNAAFGEATRRLAGAARESVEHVRTEVARAVRSIVPAASGTLLYDEHDGALTCVAACGEPFAHFVGSTLARDDVRALPSRALVAAHRIRLTKGDDPLHPRDRDELAVPLCLSPGSGSVLVVASASLLAGDAIEALVDLAAHAAPAYAVAREREHDRRRAEFDGLTGLLTPRAFRDRLAALVARAAHAASRCFGLVFVDTDHFKAWNDEYGHGAGDALLRELAGLLRNAASAHGDLVARNGGDEFCVVFAECDKATAIERAAALRRAIAAMPLGALRAPAAGTGVRITASIGVAAFPADCGGASELLEQADAAMYHTKATGRDGVSYVGPDRRLVRLAEHAADGFVRP
ncbi:MAG TPA: GGDEF domain-containing protein [Candidatus Elarobacter sp.]|jgi:diguanylate cyclase (GGDEF)-like protein